MGNEPIDEVVSAHAIPKSAFSREFSRRVFDQFRNERRTLLVDMISEATGQEISPGDRTPQPLPPGELGESVSDEFEVQA
jgi:hypothetical protein